jgi:basic membrane protein A
VAVATIGSRTDGAWSQGIYEAYLYLQDRYGDIVDITFTDLVPWGDFPTFLEVQGELGTELLYTDSGQTWGEAMKAVSPKYPDTWYAVPGSDAGVIALLPRNVAGYDRREEQGYFIAGAIAAMKSEAQHIGLVVGVDYPELIRCGTGMELGAKWVNPDIQVEFMVVGSWIDPEKGYESAQAMIATGADVIFQYADESGLGVLKAAQEENKWFVGVVRDQHDMAPDIILTSVLLDHYLLAERALLDYRSGTITHTASNYSLIQGWPAIAPVSNVSDEIAAVADKLTEAIATEVIHVPSLRTLNYIGTVWPDDYDIPSAEELGIELP